MKRISYLILSIVAATYLSGCGDSDKPSASISDTSAVYNPVAMDDDDLALNEESPVEWVEVEEQQLAVDSAEFTSAAAGRCSNHYSTRMNSGRMMFKPLPPFYRYAKYASVRASNGYYVPRVILSKANRTRSGFVMRKGETTPNIMAVWLPRGNKSNRITICLK